ncbi:MAG TPA: hypothetical protein PK047_02075 [Saprospiraceae bacterium]|nr:hypothetical protein [Saprospiraceae bacterium]HRO07624.1 hypothetical protein [Saprospiraceae bacterium]HRP40907.1 hypothetical protein [Saprospiraceae bacterium]
MILRWTLLVVLYFTITTYPVMSQVSFQPKNVNNDWKGIIYRYETTGMATLHTNGFSIAYNKGKIRTYYKTTYYHIEAGFLKDAREQNQNRNIPISFNKVSQSFKFGKQHYFYNVRAGKGTKILLTDKARRQGVSVGYNYEGGFSLGVLRPYYLELVYNYEENGRYYNELRTEKYSLENADKFLDFNSIFSGASGGKGWSEISIVPGIQGKLGLFFSIGSMDQYTKNIELGIMGDLYIKKIPIMVETPAVSSKPYFINFYLTVELGKKYN